MKAIALREVARNVTNMKAASLFYQQALGFVPQDEAKPDPELAAVLGLAAIHVQKLRLGNQIIALTQCVPAGAPYPVSAGADDALFQHIAIVTNDMAAAYQRLVRHAATPISTNGPVRLPASSGGVTAFKFRDPDGHPLELLAFPQPHAAPGYDHSAIVVRNLESSIAFYASLGLVQAGRGLNQGAEQSALDGLAAPLVDVIALKPASPTPHLELLHYRHPPASPAAQIAQAAPNDIAADRLVFASTTPGLTHLQDPDGHALILAGALPSPNIL